MSQITDWLKCREEQENLLPETVTELDIDKDVKSEEYSVREASLHQKIINKDIVECKDDIKMNPNSPLFSVKSFEAIPLKPNILKGIYAMGFNAPSKIQEIVLPALLANPPQNLIAQSQAGTGKTVAFLLAMLSKVDPEKNYPQVLCLSPTYELVKQTGDILAQMARFCPEILYKVLFRGENIPNNSKLTEHIIIGTPGKVFDWGIKFKVFDISKISVFVIDEADIIIATGEHQDLFVRIHKCLNKKCQMMFFSATYADDIMEFAEVCVRDPLIIRLHREQECPDNIKQYFVKCANQQEKYKAITNVYGVLAIGQCIIFCHTRRKASWLAERMYEDGHAVALLTTEFTVEQRISILDRFRAAKEKVLIATNVLSRGIDVEQVTLIVNFDLPICGNGQADCDTYLQRITRTGRFGKPGLAINLIDSENSMKMCKVFENYFGRKILPLNTNDYDELEKIGV